MVQRNGHRGGFQTARELLPLLPGSVRASRQSTHIPSALDGRCMAKRNSGPRTRVRGGTGGDRTRPRGRTPRARRWCCHRGPPRTGGDSPSRRPAGECLAQGFRQPAARQPSRASRQRRSAARVAVTPPARCQGQQPRRLRRAGRRGAAARCDPPRLRPRAGGWDAAPCRYTVVLRGDGAVRPAETSVRAGPQNVRPM